MRNVSDVQNPMCNQERQFAALKRRAKAPPGWASKSLVDMTAIDGRVPVLLRARCRRFAESLTPHGPSRHGPRGAPWARACPAAAVDRVTCHTLSPLSSPSLHRRRPGHSTQADCPTLPTTHVTRSLDCCCQLLPEPEEPPLLSPHVPALLQEGKLA